MCSVSHSDNALKHTDAYTSQMHIPYICIVTLIVACSIWRINYSSLLTLVAPPNPSPKHTHTTRMHHTQPIKMMFPTKLSNELPPQPWPIQANMHPPLPPTPPPSLMGDKDSMEKLAASGIDPNYVRAQLHFDHSATVASASSSNPSPLTFPTPPPPRPKARGLGRAVKPWNQELWDAEVACD